MNIPVLLNNKRISNCIYKEKKRLLGSGWNSILLVFPCPCAVVHRSFLRILLVTLRYDVDEY